MTTLLNSFEGGTSGNTITAGTSGGASGNAFDVVTPGASSTLAFSNTHAAHGTLSCEVATGASSVTNFVAWTTSLGTQAQVWFRQYLYFTAAPAASVNVLRFLNGSTPCAQVNVLLTTGQLRFQDTNGLTILTTTAGIPLNQWFRIEGFVIGSASVGQVQVKLFDSPNSTVPTETDTSAATQNTFGSLNAYRFGVGSATANVAAYWMDDIGLSNTGYIGPATAKGTTSIVPSLVAAGVI